MGVNEMNFLRWLIDAAVLLWFFHPPAEQRDSRRVLRLAGVILCLLATLPLYFYTALLPLGTLFRFIYRTVIHALLFRLARALPWDWCVYYSLIIWLVFNICSNTLLASALYLDPMPQEKVLLQVLFFGLLRFIILAVISRGIPFAYTERPGALRFGFVFFLCCVELYIRVAQRGISVRSYEEVRVYLILLQVLLGAALAFFERFPCTPGSCRKTSGWQPWPSTAAMKTRWPSRRRRRICGASTTT